MPRRAHRDRIADSPGSEFLEHYTDLPGSMPDSVVAEAERITAGATSDYDRALALQNHLRGFTYNINVALEHDVDKVVCSAWIECGRGSVGDPMAADRSVTREAAACRSIRR